MAREIFFDPREEEEKTQMLIDAVREATDKKLLDCEVHGKIYGEYVCAGVIWGYKKGELGVCWVRDHESEKLVLDTNKLFIANRVTITLNDAVFGKATIGEKIEAVVKLYIASLELD